MVLLPQTARRPSARAPTGQTTQTNRRSSRSSSSTGSSRRAATPQATTAVGMQAAVARVARGRGRVITV